MRRPRPHRLTGSVRRLVATAVVAGLAAAAVATMVARPDGGPNRGAVGPSLRRTSVAVSLTPLPVLPSLTPLPSLPTVTLLPSLPTVTLLPALTPLPSLPTVTLLPSAPSPLTPPVVGPLPGGSGGTINPGSTLTGPTAGHGTGSEGTPGTSSSAASRPRLDTFSAAVVSSTAARSVGLSLSPPPPLEQLTPLAGISFGRAPYLWPLFLVLDLIAAGALVVVVRKSLSSTPGAD
jgi:hypothetical protein